MTLHSRDRGRPGPGLAGVAKREASYGPKSGPKAGSRASSPCISKERPAKLPDARSRVGQTAATQVEPDRSPARSSHTCPAEPVPLLGSVKLSPHSQGWAKIRDTPSAGGSVVSSNDGIWIGIDVSKAHVDVAVFGGRQWRETTESTGLLRLTTELVEVGATLAVLEASGGYEVVVAAALAAAGVPVAIVNPRQVRHFGRATGILAKTDRLDARVLARFAAVVQPEPRPLPDAAQVELTELVQRRRQVIDMIAAEKLRRRGASGHVGHQIQPRIRCRAAQP